MQIFFTLPNAYYACRLFAVEKFLLFFCFFFCISSAFVIVTSIHKMFALEFRLPIRKYMVKRLLVAASENTEQHSSRHKLMIVKMCEESRIHTQPFREFDENVGKLNSFTHTPTHILYTYGVSTTI